MACVVAGMSWRPELVVDEIPAPRKMAPYALALSADVVVAGAELGSGRLVLLHDPDGNPSWDGDHRCVAYVRANIEYELAADPLLTDVGWSWLTDALARENAAHRAPGGTVTAVSNKSFGMIEDDLPTWQVEIRASWTPELDEPDDIAAHLRAWSDLLCEAAGLPPLPPGVIPLARRRSGAWGL